MRKLLVLSVLLLSTLWSLAQQKKASSTQSTIQNQSISYPDKDAVLRQEPLPSDFPIFKETGNPKQDLANFHDAKQAWIKANPERFEKIKHLNLNVSIPKRNNSNYEK